MSPLDLLPSPYNQELMIRYHQFIESRPFLGKKRSGDGRERHHICPVSLGGSDDPDNLILLSIGDHWEAHHLLWKVYSDTCWESKMAAAFQGMQITRYDRSVDKEEFEQLKIQNARHMSSISKNTRWIHRGHSHIRVYPEVLDQFLEKGWILGHGTKFIHKFDQIRSIWPDEIESYLTQGWQLGTNVHIMGRPGSQKGISMAERLGSEERAMEHSRKLSKSLRGGRRNRIKPVHNQHKTYKELYGEERAREVGRHISKGKTGKKIGPIGSYEETMSSPKAAQARKHKISKKLKIENGFITNMELENIQLFKSFPTILLQGAGL